MSSTYFYIWQKLASIKINDTKEKQKRKKESVENLAFVEEDHQEKRKANR